MKKDYNGNFFRSLNIERFIRFFWFYVASIIAFLILSCLAVEMEDFWYFFAGLAGFSTAFFYYSMLWSLCDDILDRKGYAPGEIPLILIVVAFGFFAFLYLLLLPLKNSVEMPSTMQLERNNNNISDRKPDERVEMICKNCGYTNYLSGTDKNVICKKCGKNIVLDDISEWECPKCGRHNPTSSRMCKDCGYQK